MNLSFKILTKMIKYLENIKYFAIVGVFFIIKEAGATEDFLPMGDISAFGCTKICPIALTVGREPVEWEADVEVEQILRETGAGAGAGTGIGTGDAPCCAPQVLRGIATRKRVNVSMPKEFVNVKSETYPPFSPAWKFRIFPK